MTPELRTVVSEFRHEIDPVKGSRFLTTVAPAGTREEAQAFIERIREELRDATHNCWAWRTGAKGEVFQSSDDGEPGGSAGRPILQQLEGHDVTNAAAVVTRWFGGTKLGVGGLMRAYGGAAGQTLDRAELVTLVVMRRIEVVHPYECSGAVKGLLAAHDLEPTEADYGASVRMVLELPERDVDAFLRELSDRTAGRASSS